MFAVNIIINIVAFVSLCWPYRFCLVLPLAVDYLTV